MIKFEKTEVFNFEGALRGMRNPLNSWEKGDSFFSYDYVSYDPHEDRYEVVEIGKNDLDLAQRLIKAGSDHRKFLRQIFVSVDITAPLYWWKEFDTYKVATVANSCSTMHTIHKKEFTLEDFSHEHLSQVALSVLNTIIDNLNFSRKAFIGAFEDLPKGDKDDWWDMIQLLPSSYNQKRTVTLNYETLRNIYKSRKNHKLDEWSIGFMEWIESLPYSKELITDKE